MVLLVKAVKALRALSPEDRKRAVVLAADSNPAKGVERAKKAPRPRKRQRLALGKGTLKAEAERFPEEPGAI